MPAVVFIGSSACFVLRIPATLGRPACKDLTYRDECVIVGAMFVIVTGGREYSDRGAVRAALEQYMHPGDVLVQGGARGADRLALEEAEKMGHFVITVHANWTYYGKAAGAMRNGYMLKYFRHDLRYVVAFPGNRGTKNMVEASEKLGVEVKKVGAS